MNLFLQPTAIISILIALSVHEWAHGMVANRLGDPTAEYEGRLTLNPLAHLDLMGTLMFLIVGFGWAKPVPINPTYFQHPKRDMTLVAAAGPLSNFIIAWIAFFGLALVAPQGEVASVGALLTTAGNGPVLQVFLIQLFSYSIFINLALMSFNLLPVAPLDGSKVLAMFIPARYELQYDAFMQRGPMILLILILGGLFLGLPILSTWVFGIMSPILKLMGTITGMIG